MTPLDRFIANTVTQLSLNERLELQQLLRERGMSEGRVQQIVPMPAVSLEQLADIIMASQPKSLIDLDAPAHIPKGYNWYNWEVREEDQLPSRVVGPWTWDPSKVALYLSDRQQNDYDTIRGFDLKAELQEKGVPVFGAQLLDFLLKNPHLIPEEWKDKFIFFWGTIYRANNNLYIRYLCWDGSRWFWSCGRLGEHWDRDDPALILASSS